MCISPLFKLVQFLGIRKYGLCFKFFANNIHHYLYPSVINIFAGIVSKPCRVDLRKTEQSTGLPGIYFHISKVVNNQKDDKIFSLRSLRQLPNLHLKQKSGSWHIRKTEKKGKQTKFLWFYTFKKKIPLLHAVHNKESILVSGHFFLQFSLLFPTLAVVYLKAFAVSVVGVCLFPTPLLKSFIYA